MKEAAWAALAEGTRMDRMDHDRYDNGEIRDADVVVTVAACVTIAAAVLVAVFRWVRTGRR